MPRFDERPPERRDPPNRPPAPAPPPTPPASPPALPTGSDIFPFPTPTSPGSNQDTQTIPPDQIGDIPPPPVPTLPGGVGVSGAPGLGGSTFARPDSRGIRPFQTPRAVRFGPGVPFAGGAAGSGDPSGMGVGLTPEEAAELLRGLAVGLSGSGG